MDGDGHDGQGGGHASHDHGAGGHFGGGHGDLHGHGHDGDGHDHGGHVTHEAIVMAFAHGAHDSHAGHGFGFSHSHSSGHSHSHSATLTGSGRQGHAQRIAGTDIDELLETQHADCGCQDQGGADQGKHPDGGTNQPADTDKGKGKSKDQAPKPAEPPKMTDKTRTFLVHVVNHGHVECMKHFYAMAGKYDLIRIDDRRPNYDTVHEVRYELSDWNAWAKPYNDGDMPDGFLPGLNGTTTFYRQSWQVGKRKHFWSKPEFDNKAMTFIEVSFVVWQYYETADFETKLTLRVVSFPAYDHQDGRWGYRKAAFERHQKAARAMGEEIFAKLKAIPHSPESALLRAFHLKNLPEPPRPPQRYEGSFPADRQEEVALERSEILREKAHDTQTRTDAGQNGPATESPGTPADNSGADLANLVPVSMQEPPVVPAGKGKVTVDVPDED